MWDVPVYRVRAYLRTVKRQRLARSNQPRPPLHFKRANAEIRIFDGYAFPRSITAARLVLNDMTPSGLYLFSSEPIRVGQKLALSVESPYRFYVRGYAYACKLSTLNAKVISDQSFPYRVGIQFEFQSEEERGSVRKYCEELLHNHICGGY